MAGLSSNYIVDFKLCLGFFVISDRLLNVHCVLKIMHRELAVVAANRGLYLSHTSTDRIHMV